MRVFCPKVRIDFNNISHNQDRFTKTDGNSVKHRDFSVCIAGNGCSAWAHMGSHDWLDADLVVRGGLDVVSSRLSGLLVGCFVGSDDSSGLPRVESGRTPPIDSFRSSGPMAGPIRAE